MAGEQFGAFRRGRRAVALPLRDSFQFASAKRRATAARHGGRGVVRPLRPHTSRSFEPLARDPPATRRIAASSAARSTGLVRCSANPAARLAAMSDSIP